MTDVVILYALPVFLLLIAAEWSYGVVKGKSTYRINDCISSLSQGLLSQAAAVCTQLFQIGLYTIIFKRLAVVHAAAFWQTAVGWIVAVALFDFFDYWLHRASHEIAVLWAAHVVHHQSEHFNFSTALRQESLLPLFGWAFYIPMAILGVPPAQFALAGLVVLLYQFWIHTEHIGKLGWFDRVFSSPSNHRVHHAINPQYTNKNYGAILVVWDRLFGTFASEEEVCVFGTQTPLASWNPIWAVASIYVALAHDAIRTRRLRDKLRLWFMPTGWHPDDMRDKNASANKSARQTFDPPLTRKQAVFSLTQLAAMTVLTAVMLSQADTLDFIQTTALCIAIASGLWLAGAVIQSRLRVQFAVPLTAAMLWAVIMLLR